MEHTIEKSSKTVFKRPKSYKENYVYPFCAGCGHGVALRLVAEVLEELDVAKKTIAVASVGCSINLDKFYNLDIVGADHGRAPCVATGVKRAKPDRVVFTYQGDGDAATIGFNELIHTALRGEKITTICINNTNFGMTGGQASATSIIGQVTATTQTGRDPNVSGYPAHIAEMISLCEGSAFVARGAIYSPQSILNTKKLIKKAFECQTKGLGFGFVEIIAACPTGWKLKPIDSLDYIKNEIIKVHKPAIFKDITESTVQ